MKNNRTKIICTIGPSIDSPSTLHTLAQCGMSIIRINCSHGTTETRTRQMTCIRNMEQTYASPIGVMLDLQGPKLRIGDLPSPFKLASDDIWKLSTHESADEKQKILPIPSHEIAKSVEVGDALYMDDGLIYTQVIRKDKTDLWVKVINGGFLESRKGINIPYYKGTLPILSAKDKQDLCWGIEFKVDFVALSFVRYASDIAHLKAVIRQYKPQHEPLIIAKIEKPEAVENMDEIIAASDGILVARGDLGIELPPEKVPVVQKQLIEKCRLAKKPVIIATQMLDSMRINPRPTRAEVSDVASSIYAGADAVMLTGETSSGKYPVQATEMLQNIICEVERHMVQKTFRKLPEDFGIGTYQESVMFNVMQLAEDIDAKAIVVLTQRGDLTKFLSKLHPKQPIFSLALSVHVHRQMTLYWGVFPIENYPESVNGNIDDVITTLKKQHIVKKNDRLIFVSRNEQQSENLNLKIVACDSPSKGG